MNTLKLKILLLLFAVSTVFYGQQKLEKLSKTISVDKDVTIDLDLSHVEIEVSTWDKNSLEVVAYVESDKLSKEELKKALENWKIDISGSGDYVKITSLGASNTWVHADVDWSESLDALRELEFELADLPEMPEMPKMPEMPEMEHLANMPPMPKLPKLPDLPDGINNVNFDYDEYKKDGQKYLEKWGKEYEAKYGKEYSEKMKAWAKEFGKVDWDKFEKDMEEWGEKFGKEFSEKYEKDWEEWGEKFGEKFGKDFERKMEAWGERYAKQMEKRAEMLEERMEEREARMAERHEEQAKRIVERRERVEERQKQMVKREKELVKRLETRSSIIKSIKIKMPKKAKLKMDVRHGELKFSSVIYDLKADISHGTLVADYIDGSETSINVSYSPLVIRTWNTGELNLNFVKEAQITNVNTLMLNSDSSNIRVGNISGNAIINGSFGDLTIDKVSDSFNNLNVILENTDALIHLPSSEYSLTYNGNRSKIIHPQADARATTFSLGKLNSGKSIVINSKFSNLILQ